ncbi:MAG: FecR domain-containing protein [Lachnospiraceae bacterium]|nr:FecR domain-containing protein [Lachnospiraceae bacterium]
METKKKKIIIAAAVLLAVIIGIILYLIFGRNRLSATTMRIIRYEGDVTLLDDGKESTLMENMLLHNGNTLATQQESYIDISLDDTKMVGLDQKSRAEFYQSGKKLDIALKAGGIYFYTTEKLKDDETFDIRTATMIVGIRGTSGYVHVDEETGVTTLYLTSGKVHITGNNPVTGGTREADITAGQCVTTYLYNDRQGEDSIEFVIESFTEQDLPIHYVKRMVKVPSLLKEVEKEAGLSADILTGIADGQGEGDPADLDVQEMTEGDSGKAADDAEAADGETDTEEDDAQGAVDAAAEAAQTSDGEQKSRAGQSPQSSTKPTQNPQGSTNTTQGGTDGTGSTQSQSGQDTQDGGGSNASQDKPSYTVTVKEADGGSVSADVSSAKEGATVTLTASPKSGYKLGSFSVKDSSGASVSVTDKDSNQAEFQMPAGNVTVTATFKKKAATYQITVKKATGGTVTASVKKAKKGKKVTLTATPKDGYELSSFTVKDKDSKAVTVTKKGTNKATFKMPASKVTVQAKFKKTQSQTEDQTEEQTYTVTVQTATGGSMSANPSSAKAGDTVTLTATPESGYELESVSVTDGGGSSVATTAGSSANVVTFTMPSGNVTVTPSFKKSYTITIPTVANAEVKVLVNNAESSDKTAYAGEQITIKVKPAAGYELDTATLKVNVDNGGGVTLSSPETDNEGYVSTSFTMPSGDVTFAAPTLTKISYSITLSTVANASISASIEGRGTVTSAQVGDQVAVAVTPNTGYELSALSVKDSGNQDISVTGSSFTMPADNVTVTATVVKSEYDITISAVDHASVTAQVNGASAEKATYGDTVAIEVTPDGGYELDTLTVKDSSNQTISVANNGFTMPADGVTVTVTLKKTIYQITLPTITGAEISAKIGNDTVTQAQVDDQVTIEVAPDAQHADYQVGTFRVQQTGGQEVSNTKASANQYSFTMPAGAVTISVTLVRVSRAQLDLNSDMLTVAGGGTDIPIQPLYINVMGSDESLTELSYISEEGSNQKFGNASLGLYALQDPGLEYEYYAYIEYDSDGTVPVAVRASDGSEDRIAEFTQYETWDGYWAAIGEEVTLQDGNTVQLIIEYNVESGSYMLTIPQA